MFEQISKDFFDFGRKSAGAALKAHGIAAKTAGEAFQLQWAAAEAGGRATTKFWQDAGEVRDFESASAIWSQGTDIARGQLDKAVEVNSQVFDLGVKRGQEIAELFQGNFEAAKGQAKKTTAKA